MLKFALILIGMSVLVACGGSHKRDSLTNNTAGVVTRAGNASGPISQACLSGSRRGASQQLCGCVQAAADQTLSKRDQQRGSKFFSDPQSLQDLRQSDNRSNEKYWERWQVFTARAEAMCARV
jgi:hypothetical protein